MIVDFDIKNKDKLKKKDFSLSLMVKDNKKVYIHKRTFDTARKRYVVTKWVYSHRGRQRIGAHGGLW